MRKYTLDGHTPIECDDVIAWATWFEKSDRIVKQEDFSGIRVSTVFLGLDHSWGDNGPPLIFETMIFGGEHSDKQWRYSTWDQAEAGHKEAVKLVLGNAD